MSTRLIIFEGDPAEIDAKARALIRRIDKALGYPNEHTKTWQKDPLPHPTDPRKVGVWMKLKCEKHVHDSERKACLGVEQFEKHGWRKPREPEAKLARGAIGKSEAARPAARIPVSGDWRFTSGAVIAAAALAAALYYFFG